MLSNEFLTDAQRAENLVTQQNMRAINQGIRVHVLLWIDGLITDKEITAHFAQLNERFARANVSGLIDINTGLRYL